MIIVNKTNRHLSIQINRKPVFINPKSNSVDYLVSENDIRKLLISFTHEEINFKLTNQRAEHNILSGLNVDVKYLHKDEEVSKEEAAAKEAAAKEAAANKEVEQTPQWNTKKGAKKKVKK